MERTKPNARELSAIEYIAALDAQLMGNENALRARLATIPHGWRDWRLITTQTGRLLEKIYDTLPTKTLRRMEGLCRHGEVIVRIRPPCPTSEHALVSEDDLRQIINSAMAAECAICLKDGREIDACALRKALEHIAPPEAYEKVGCAYRLIAAQSAYGQYI